jgi:hypothetical protein
VAVLPGDFGFCTDIGPFFAGAQCPQIYHLARWGAAWM